MNVFKLMANNEELVGRLYRQYAVKLPSSAELWNKLAEEEDSHASWLINLQQQADAGFLSIDAKRFNESAVKRFSEYLQAEFSKLQNERVSLLVALSAALYIEEALIERKFFEVLGADCPELKNTLDRLRAETEVHLEKVKQALAVELSRR